MTQWQHALHSGGHRQPDGIQVAALERATDRGSASYKAARTLVVLQPHLRPTHLAALVDKGLDRARHVQPTRNGHEQFAGHPACLQLTVDRLSA
ncbi:MAG: hypothetical protein V9G23_16200 [Giesbergeria sp.]